MDRMKYAVLITAMAAAAFVTAGCEQSAQGDKVGQRSDQANPSVMGKLGQADTNKSAQPANADHAGSKASGVDDTMITTKIKAKLLAVTPGGQTSDVRVSTKAGAVTLTGTVTSEAERQRALDAANSTDGVEKVNDLIRVQPTQNKPTEGQPTQNQPTEGQPAQ